MERWKWSLPVEVLELSFALGYQQAPTVNQIPEQELWPERENSFSNKETSSQTDFKSSAHSWAWSYVKSKHSPDTEKETNLASDIHAREIIPRVWLCKSKHLCFSYDLTETFITLEIVEDVAKCSTATHMRLNSGGTTIKPEGSSHHNLEKKVYRTSKHIICSCDWGYTNHIR